MAKRVNNIAYKGINHSPSLVSDNDGHASECANLSPDFNDLKPMPMPVKKSGTYQVPDSYTLIFVHRGVGYENYISIDESRTRLIFQDEDGNYLYDNGQTPPYWSSDDLAEILAIEAVGNTLVVSTKEGTEYIVYQPDVPLGQAAGSYKPIGQKPPMPIIEFRLETTDENYYNKSDSIDENQASHIVINGVHYLGIDEPNENLVTPFLRGVVAKLEKRLAENKRFYQPFFVRYAIRLKTGDYIMQSSPVLMLPSTDKCPFEALLFTTTKDQDDNWHIMNYIAANIRASKLKYKIHSFESYDDWRDIISGVDVYISNSLYNYETQIVFGMEYGNQSQLADIHQRQIPNSDEYGYSYSDGEILQLPTAWPYNIDSWVNSGHCFSWPIKSVDEDVLHAKIKSNSIFYKIASIDIGDMTQMDSYEDMPIESLANLANLPTLEDDYNSHYAVSAKLLQTYNSRLNMANISQKVFDGFEDAYQPQPADPQYHVGNYYIRALCVYFKVKKNGKTYIVRNQTPTVWQAISLNYTTYLYYPDPDCYEAVVYFGENAVTYHLLTIPMKRHEYLNGSYWYDDMTCLAQYILNNVDSWQPGSPMPTLSPNLWYDIPNRFMMSATGNPWYFPLQETFDIGLREIRALSVNTENMDAPQYGQNPIYVFSTDGIWTIGINKDGKHNGISYVSGDVISEAQGIGSSPTASAPQTVFFKTSRGIMAATGSKVQSIDLVMRGRVFNPRTRLLPAGSIIDGVPTAGINSYWLDLIFNVCDDLPYADFAKDSNLIYDYRNNRLLLHNGKKQYMYVYDVAANFWGKMLPMVVDESPTSPAIQEFNTRGRSTVSYTIFNATVTAGSYAILTDNEGHLWYVGGQPDENDITATQFGLYVSRPMRFGTDDYKTLSRVVHDYQTTYLENSYQNDRHEYIRMGLWGSRDGRKYWQINTLRGTSYKFFIIVLYTRMLPSSRYAYTAFEWEARMTDKIR